MYGITLKMNSPTSSMNLSKDKIICIYSSDKVPIQYADENEFGYLILKNDYQYYLNYTDTERHDIVVTGVY